MSLRRFCTVAGRLLILSAAVLIVPACKKKVDEAPHLVKVIPNFNANGVSHFPLIVLEFNKAMDASTINTTNITIEDHTVPIPAPFGGGWTVTYHPTTFQAVVTPLAPLPFGSPGPDFDVIVYPQVKSADGFFINAPVTGGVAARFKIGNIANSFKPSFSTPVAAQGSTQGTIDFTWTQAQENSVNISANYDIYMGTAPGDIDLARGFFLTRTDNSGFTMGNGGLSGTLTPGTTYYFIVVCRDNDGNVTVTGEISATAKP